jgi:hypothetical protein
LSGDCRWLKKPLAEHIVISAPAPVAAIGAEIGMCTVPTSDVHYKSATATPRDKEVEVVVVVVTWW